MYARLWWKDLRQFWTIWVFLLLAALASQVIALRYAGSDAKMGVLPPLMLSFAWLYAVAVGAAAFAGERENGTLRFLDTLPVDRFLLWRGKASFALASTLALAILLMIPAALLTARWEPTLKENPVLVALGYFVLVVEALGWGIFVSAFSRTALTAALGGACCSAASLAVILMNLDTTHQAELLVQSIPLRLLVIAATAAISALAMIGAQGGGRSRGAGRIAARAWSEALGTASRMRARLRSPFVIRSPIARPSESVAVRSRKLWAWWPEIRAVAWLTFHQGSKLAGLLVLVGVGMPVLLNIALVRSAIDAGFFVMGFWAVTLVAGIKVFGAESRGRTDRFLAHHGARPGLVWGTKLLTWALAFVLILLVVIPPIFAFIGPPRITGPADLVAWIGMWLYPFFPALLCGMVIRRGITAWVVSLLLLAALIAPQYALVQWSLMNPYGALVPPVAMVFLTWAWRRDWMLDRPAPGRWIRLGAWSAATLAVIFGWFIGDRAWGVPDSPPVAPPQAWTASTVPDEQNAAKLYAEIPHKRFSPFIRLNLNHFSDAWIHEQVADAWFFKENPEAYGLVRKAAAMPKCSFLTDPGRLTEFNGTELPPMYLYGGLLAIHAGDLGRKGDLAGAWDDIEALFRMARQIGQSELSRQGITALTIEEGALGLAMQWATDPLQTPERIRAALDSYRKLPPMIPAPEIVRGEARIMEQTLDLPRAEIRDFLLNRYSDRKEGPTTWEAIGADASTTPWEIERARRVNRLQFAAQIDEAGREPSRRDTDRVQRIKIASATSVFSGEARRLSHLSPNTWFFVERNDRNEVGRRALVQILALRIWQLEHGGKLPPVLDVLVPGLLPSLPADPYSKDFHFIYMPSDGKLVPPLHQALPTTGPRTLDPISTVGYRLLYSIGINQHDNGGTFEQNNPLSIENDIVFPLKDDVGKPIP